MTLPMVKTLQFWIGIFCYFLQPTSSQVTVIDGIWSDNSPIYSAALEDTEGITGWKKEESACCPLTLTVDDTQKTDITLDDNTYFGASYVYHTVFRGIDWDASDRVITEMTRRFQCQTHSSVSVSWAMAFCRGDTSGYGWVEFENADYSLSGDIRSHVISALEFSSLESGNAPVNVLDANYPSGWDPTNDCRTAADWKYVIESYIQFANVVGGTDFDIHFIIHTLFGGAIFDIKINCDASANPPDPQCDNGIIKNDYCCLSSCTQCGGSGCALAGTLCCTGAIRDSGFRCDDTSAPCIITTSSPTPKPTPLPTPSPTEIPTPSPTFDPTIDPTVDPTVEPTMNPTFSPSIAPSSAPSDLPTAAPVSECIDYHGEQSNDGELLEENIEWGLNNYPFVDSPETLILTASETRMECKDNVDCFVRCLDALSCYDLNTTISNSSKNILVYCDGRHSCADSSVSVQSMVSMLNISVICSAPYSCINMHINVQNVDSFKLICSNHYSCLDVEININISNDEYDTKNETSNHGIISCVSRNSCDGMTIVTDSVDTELKMTEYSEDVTLDNQFGYDFLNIVCNDRFVRYQKGSGTQSEIDQAIMDEYGIDELDVLPCGGVLVKCGEFQCLMKYISNIPSDFASLPTDKCYWIDVDHLIDWQCEGQCATSPTDSPTESPSNSPTEQSESPTSTPSISPTTAPSTSPTFVPSNSPTFVPSFSPSKSPSNQPTSSPSTSPSNAPSHSPTHSPTRYPTNDMNQIYSDLRILVTYRLKGLNIANILLLETETLTAVSSIIQLIERGYFFALNELFEIEYRDFALFIYDINGYDISDVYLKPDTDILLNGNILMRESNAAQIVEASTTTKFKDKTQSELVVYFGNNENVEFEVVGATLEIQEDTEHRGSLIVFWISIILMFCGLCLSLFVYYKNKQKESVIDNAKFLAPIFFTFQIYDLLSDVNLSYDILTNPMAYSGGNKINIVFWCGIFSVIFTVIPFVTNLLYGVRITKQRVIADNDRAHTYFTNKIALFITLIVVSGGCYPALVLVSSRLFNLDLLYSGLTHYELTQLTAIKIKSTITLENGPQLLVQIVYAILTSSDAISLAVFLAFIGSILSIVTALAQYYANKISHRNAEFEIYSVQFVNNNLLTNQQEEKFKKKKERKESLQKLMAKEFGTSHENLEIGFCKIITNGLEMRIIQFIPSSELSGYSQFGYNIALQPKQFVMKLYDDHKEQINVAFRTHFEIELDSFVVQLIVAQNSKYQPIPSSSLSQLNPSNIYLSNRMEIKQISKNIEAMMNFIGLSNQIKQEKEDNPLLMNVDKNNETNTNINNGEQIEMQQLIQSELKKKDENKNLNRTTSTQL